MNSFIPLPLRRVAVGAATVALALSGAVVAAAPATAATTPQSVTFGPTSSVQTFVVPDGVHVMRAQVAGAQGGSSFGGGGGGAQLDGDVEVVPGQTLNIVVGTVGRDGYVYSYGAAGGGGSFVYTTPDQAGLLVAAGGGGGAASNNGASGASLTTDGTAGGVGGGVGGTGGAGGGGSVAGGGGGLLTGGGGQGGQSLAAGAAGTSGGGYGGGGGTGDYAGGGGGGYSGGGGGGFANGGAGGGGGGGSFCDGLLTSADANHGGDGKVVLSWVTRVPEISAVTPSTFATGSAPTLTITGVDFTGATAVTFGSTPATSFTVDSDTQITAVVPADLRSGAVDVFIVSSGGTSAADAGSRVTSAPVVIVGPASLPAAKQGVAYSQRLQADGETAPYDFAVTAGTLPDGLVLSPAGLLSGTPTASGTFPVTVTATGAGGSSGSADLVVTVESSAPTVTGVSPSVGSAGDVVVIDGTDLAGASVTIGGVPALPVTGEPSSTSLSVVVPAPAADELGRSQDVVVTTAFGTVTVAGAFRYEDAAAVPAPSDDPDAPSADPDAPVDGPDAPADAPVVPAAAPTSPAVVSTPSGDLAFTGADLTWALLAAGGLLAVGATAVVVGRRRVG